MWCSCRGGGGRMLDIGWLFLVFSILRSCGGVIIILLSFSSCHSPDEVVVMHVLPLAPAVSHKGGRLGYIISCEGSVDRLSGGVVCAIYIYVHVVVGWWGGCCCLCCCGWHSCSGHGHLMSVSVCVYSVSLVISVAPPWCSWCFRAEGMLCLVVVSSWMALDFFYVGKSWSGVCGAFFSLSAKL